MGEHQVGGVRSPSHTPGQPHAEPVVRVLGRIPHVEQARKGTFELIDRIPERPAAVTFIPRRFGNPKQAPNCAEVEVEIDTDALEKDLGYLTQLLIGELLGVRGQTVSEGALVLHIDC
jgi:hypothetical protein